MDIKVTDTSTGRLIKNQILADKIAALHNGFRGRVIEKLAFLFPYLPENHGGLLPRWLLVISAISIANSLQAYLTLAYTARVYSENPSLSTKPSSPSPEHSKHPSSSPKSSDADPPPTAVSAYPSSPDAPNSTVTPLTARIFGTWTLIQSLVRLYAAYNISNPQFYGLAFATYAVAWLHFMSEWWVFGTVKWGAPLAGPVFISTGSLVWMWMQWGWYVQ